MSYTPPQATNPAWKQEMLDGKMKVRSHPYPAQTHWAAVHWTHGPLFTSFTQCQEA